MRLAWVNLVGVAILVALCVQQWRVNRGLNLSLLEAERRGQAQERQLAEREGEILMLRSDLEELRGQVSLKGEALIAAERSTTRAAARERRLAEERDAAAAELKALREAVSRWAAAVAERDAALGRANETIASVVRERDEAIRRVNEIVATYNELVDRWVKAAGQIPEGPVPVPATTMPTTRTVR